MYNYSHLLVSISTPLQYKIQVPHKTVMLMGLTYTFTIVLHLIIALTSTAHEQKNKVMLALDNALNTPFKNPHPVPSPIKRKAPATETYLTIPERPPARPQEPLNSGISPVQALSPIIAQSLHHRRRHRYLRCNGATVEHSETRCGDTLWQLGRRDQTALRALLRHPRRAISLQGPRPAVSAYLS